MQRRIEQPDRHRQALHDLEQLDKIRALHRQQLGECGAARFLVIGKDHLAHRANAILVEEHVLGTAKPDALGAELECDARIVRRVRVGAHTELARRVGPAHQRCELAGERRLTHRHAACKYLPGRAVDGDDVAGLERPSGDAHGARCIVDPQRASAGNARLAHAARHHGRMRGHAPARGENPLGRVHAVDIFGRGLNPHEDHALVLGLERLRLIGREHDLTGCRAGRGRKARCDDLALGLRINRGMQQLVERRRLDARNRLFA